MNTYYIENIALNKVNDNIKAAGIEYEIIDSETTPKFFSKIITSATKDEIQRVMPLQNIKNIPVVSAEIDYIALKMLLRKNRCSFAIVK